MSDQIRLVLPAQSDYRSIAHLVVGGLGARLDLTLEHLEDVQVAVEALLGCRDDGGELVVTLDVEERLVCVVVGPFPEGALELDGDDGQLGLRRVLATVCDTFELREQGDESWVAFTKQTPERVAASVDAAH